MEEAKIKEDEEAAAKEEEEKLKKIEMEKSFDAKGELANLGGKLLEFNEDTDEHSQHYTWLIPCYFKYSEQSDTSKFVTYLEVTSVTVQKSLTLNHTTIDFGEIAVGIREIRDLLITNHSDEVADIRMDLLPSCCGFNIINALRPIKPKQTARLIVQFQPHQGQPFEETVTISSKTTCVSAKLKGKGVRPEVKVVPENLLMNIGGVTLGESCDKIIKVSNVSHFAIKFKIESLSHGIYNLNGSKVMSYIPSEASIEAQGSINIKVIFKPDRISEKFFELIKIEVPNQFEPKILYLWGYCFPRSGYLSLYQPILKTPTEDHLQKKIESPFDILKIKDEDTIFSPSNHKIVLEFTKIVKQKEESGEQQLLESCTQRKIVCGNCKMYSDPKLEKPVAYEINMPKDDKFNYFDCDKKGKGTANAGLEDVITFTFKPPQIDNFIDNIDALQGLGQWKELKAELKLTGGYLMPGVQDTWTFEIILRAYINQI